MSYRIIEANSAEKLQELVNEAIAEGWETIGGVACCTKGDVLVYAQAMDYDEPIDWDDPLWEEFLA